MSRFNLVREMWLRKALGKGRKTLSGVPPLIFRSDGSVLKNYRLYGAAGGLGDYDEESGKYVIPVTIARKNKFDGTLFNGYYTDSTMTSIGGASGNYKSFKLLLSAGTYTFSCSIPVLIIRYITSDIYRSNPIGSKYTQEYTFTLANDSYVSLAFRNESNTAWDDSTTIQVELSQSATEYEPLHEPSTINIFLDEPVYEGESVSMEDTGVHIGTIDGTNITGSKLYDRFAALSDESKEYQLKQAAQRIEQLPFTGRKNSIMQYMSFSRKGQEDVPYQVRTAQALEAAAPLDSQAESRRTLQSPGSNIRYRRTGKRKLQQ